MSDFTPVWKVTINGVEYTGDILAGLTITSGRTDIYSQPVAGYCAFDLLNLDLSASLLEINQGVTVQIKDSTGTYVSLFGGNVTDFVTTVQNAGSVTYVTSTRITALGTLARLPRATTLGVLHADFEGDQIYTILTELLTDMWSEVPAAETWATYTPATGTWADAYNLGLGEIDQGLYEQVARSSSVTDVYSLVSYLATSGFGYLYEDGNGKIGYASTDHRQLYLAANGYTNLSANQSSFAGLSSAQRAGDVRNKITLKYGNNSASETTSTDATSIALYGRKENIVTTSVKHAADAISQADRYLALRAYPRSKLDGVTYQLTNNEMSDAQRDDLLNVFMGLPLNITDLPITMDNGQFQGYVEGWTWQSSYNGLTLTMNLSPVEFSQYALRWDQVSGSEAWNTISNTLTWEEALETVA
jgi:hypothetical protein